MSIESLRDVAPDVAVIAAGLSPILADVGAALTTGSASAGQLGRLNTALESSRDEARDLRDALGEVVVADYQFGDDAADRLELWDWQIGTVTGLRKLAGHAQRAQDTISVLLEGRRPQTYEVRSGETLQSIAAKTLGSWQEWHRLVTANGLDPAASLPAGTLLIIPERR